MDDLSDRPGWPETFISIAEVFARRATCRRGKVGAVIVTSDNRVLATGYNGSLPGQPHCIDEGCLMDEGHCVRTVHAEMNALAYAANHGVSVEGATMYCTHSPCLNCLRILLASGILHFVYLNDYRPSDLVVKLIGQTAGATFMSLEEAKALRRSEET